MDPFASYAHIDNPQQFWAELDELLDQPFHPSQDNSELEKQQHAVRLLKSFLALCQACFDGNLTSQYNQEYCINRLFGSVALKDDPSTSVASPSLSSKPLHQLAAEEAVKLVQTATSIPILLMAYEFVLQYGESFPSTYKTLQASASALSISGLRSFLHRLVHQVWAGSYAAQAEAKIGIQHDSAPPGWAGADWDQSEPSPNQTQHPSRVRVASQSKGLLSSSASKDLAMQISLREKAIRMLYETCRVQKLEHSHLKAFDQRFIHHLFDLVEETRHHHDEGFNYLLIKLIVAINEQYMVSTLGASGTVNSNSAPLTGTRPENLVLSVLKARLNDSKTFGENLIFMLNRASSSDAEDLCMQLLVLKLLYLLFTTKETSCYFYTNDLKVLVDVFIRELSDLPDESESLRHTYLRVLHPLLTNTQLCTYPYKRPQIRRLLIGLVSHGHLREIGATTRRLVERCLKAEWCVELDRLDGTSSVAIVAPIGGGQAHEKKMTGEITNEGLPVLRNQLPSQATIDRTAETVANTPQDPDDTHSLQSPISPVNSSPIEPPTPGSVSDDRLASPATLTVPPHMRTRDKRVLSLSHPRPTFEASSDSGLGPQSQGGYRRAVSAKSAPASPPRIDSPAPSQAESEGSDTHSAASSWHAHMTEPMGKRRSASSHHPYLHHSSHEGLPPSNPARIGSPLSLDTTADLVDERVAIGMGLPSLHVRMASNGEREDSTATITYARTEMSTPEPTSSGGGPPRRRKPPEPPTADRLGRRALQPSPSDPGSWRSRTPSPTRTDSTASLPGAGAGGATRRRPPPPPPNRATKGADAAALGRLGLE